MTETSMTENTPAAFFDVDGTLTSERVWRGMLEYFRQRGVNRATHYLYMLRNYPSYILRKLGLISEVTFRIPWAANMAMYVKGMTPQECESIWNWVTTDYMRGNWREDILAILQDHIKRGEPVVLVSSGPYPMVKRIAMHIGTDHAVGTELELIDNLYTGRSLRPVCIDSYKASMAQDYLSGRGIRVDFANSHSYADSMTDLHLLEMVGNPVAVYPDQDLREIAIHRRWRVIPE